MSVDNKLVSKLRLSSAALSEVTLEAACYATGVSPDPPCYMQAVRTRSLVPASPNVSYYNGAALEYLDYHHQRLNPPQRPPTCNTNLHNPDETLPAPSDPWPFKVSSIPHTSTANMVSPTIPMTAAAYHNVANHASVFALLNKYDPSSLPPNLPAPHTILTKPKTAAPA